MTTWTSSRNPSLNVGRSGRSVSRAVSVAVSDGRPSRRKNPPGILPAAYMRSSTSTVSGKKSIPSRGLLLVQVARTCVSPIVTTADPPACLASLPDSRRMSLDPMALLACVVTGCPPGIGPRACPRTWFPRGTGQLSVVEHRASFVLGDPQLITDRYGLLALALPFGLLSYEEGAAWAAPGCVSASDRGVRSAFGTARCPRGGGSRAGAACDRPSATARASSDGPSCGS